MRVQLRIPSSSSSCPLKGGTIDTPRSMSHTLSESKEMTRHRNAMTADPYLQATSFCYMTKSSIPVGVTRGWDKTLEHS
eukprot:2623080-Amphidinium_carterae.2